MATSTTKPGLTPSLCFNETALRDFLRISRSSIDDTINQNLNSLLTPSTTPFDPTSPSRQSPNPRGARRLIPSDSCANFRNKILFPSWQSRSDVLSYCAGVATSPDPDDPTHILREVEDAKARERVVDERLDPYSGRYFPREARTERLAALVRNERMVEDIVRRRTWGIVGERCEDGIQGESGRGWEDALERWRTNASKEV